MHLFSFLYFLLLLIANFANLLFLSVLLFNLKSHAANNNFSKFFVFPYKVVLVHFGTNFLQNLLA